MRPITMRTIVVLGLLAVCAAPSAAPAQYLKIDPPPDTNKITTGSDLSCWLATASNMLAGAGYGNPAEDVQTRSEAIYDQMRIHFTDNW